MGEDDAGLIARVDAALADFLDERAADLERIGVELSPIADEARRTVLDGGKRLRPRFAYWGWRAIRDDEPDGLIQAAAALELLHCSALVHDDIMDASDTRRGHPSAHASFTARGDSNGWSGARLYGNASAVLLGDLLLGWSDELFTRSGLAARGVYEELRQSVMAGQYLDVLVQARGSYSAQDALHVIEFKTSRYTVLGPVHVGATAAGAQPDALDALREYALSVGEAFQLRDDVLGVWGDPSETGKPAGDDLREGKRTLLVALAMEHATPGQASLLRSSLGVRGLDDEQVAALREVLVETGALDEVERRIAARAGAARNLLRTAPINPSARDALDDLVVAATQRRT